MQVSPLNELLAQVREESKEYTIKRVLEGLRHRLLAESSQRSASSTPTSMAPGTGTWLRPRPCPF